jgi:hypothetical protein
MHFCNGHAKVDADGEGGGAGEESNQNQQSAKEFSEGRKISGPGWQTQAGDELCMMVKAAKNFVVSVTNHDGAESESNEEKRERLQAIEVAQKIPPGER